jgi:prepilin-type processing-associated H-X9-DG protein/prepilin-type N-terminal cleavage/methylation domain-containing protein
MKPESRSNYDEAFTLVELLVVIGIVTVLLSCVLPALGRAKLHARNVVCLSNLRQLGVAASSYAADAGRLPSFLEWLYALSPEGEGDLKTGSLYPYLNSKRVYLCPTQSPQVANPQWSTGPTTFQADHSYAMNCESCHAHDITACQAPARTVYLVEEANLPRNRWGSIAEPFPIRIGTNAPISTPAFPHGRRANLLMMDGHITRLNQSELQAEPKDGQFWYPNGPTAPWGPP